MTDPLLQALVEVERHVSTHGWDQPLRLYALAGTAELAQREPALAERLGLSSDAPPDELTAVEQEDLPPGTLDEMLARIGWPQDVRGCAVVQEVVSLPPEKAAQAPEDPDEAAAWASDHPERQELRLCVGVLRDGRRASCVRVRGEQEGELLTAEDLAPNLSTALLATFA